ncbi:MULTISPECIES: Flp family type IVb pilin [Burkholderia]|uniref:Flp family type IVb pilin n=5 Tax=pseudomallei group TaxID=111527 RepID=A0A7U4P4H8_9BURK|nr:MULTISPECIES: Flp family type IVb pilin [Burkholderia]ABC39222.1 pilin, putative [Burkholderia thailandensis E264]AIP63922.2 pilus assembly protein [Burkholderia thailandensis]ALX42829.1 pilus assembly protein [Burkholderia humptydooensis]AOI52084.1 pilus assembly protein [Burkholderia thailandensis]AOJ45109.1 pilus assembly protein [Burkholderia thailandensis]
MKTQGTRINMKQLMHRFFKEEAGVTAIEYGLIAGLIAVAIATTVGTVGTDLSSLFSTIASKLPAA